MLSINTTTAGLAFCCLEPHHVQARFSLLDVVLAAHRSRPVGKVLTRHLHSEHAEVGRSRHGWHVRSGAGRNTCGPRTRNRWIRRREWPVNFHALPLLLTTASFETPDCSAAASGLATVMMTSVSSSSGRSAAGGCSYDTLSIATSVDAGEYVVSLNIFPLAMHKNRKIAVEKRIIGG